MAGEGAVDRLALFEGGKESASLETSAVRRRTELVFDGTLSAMFGAMDELSRAEAALGALASTFSPAEMARLRSLQTPFQGLAAAVENKVARSHDAATRLAELMKASRDKLDDLHRLTRTATFVALNAQVVSRTVRADEGALDGLARDMRRVLGDVGALVAELDVDILGGQADLGRVKEAAAALEEIALAEALPALRDFAGLIEARARDERLARSAKLVSGRMAALQGRIRTVVVHLQVGDGMRQRLEHVEAILARGTGPAGTALASTLCRLAAAQIRASLEDLARALHPARRGLRELGHAAAAIPRAAAIDAFRGEDAGGLAAVVTGAASIEKSINGLTATGQALSEASDSLARSLATASRATQAATEFERRMTVLGLNAILISSRLGSEGRAMAKVAHQLRDIARSITEAIGLLRQDTECIAEVARALDVLEDEALDRRLAVAGEATLELSAMARSVSGQLAAMGAARTASEIARAFAQAERDLSEFGVLATTLDQTASRLGALGANAPEHDPSADEVLNDIRRSYSMAAEREVHDALFPHLRPLDPESSPELEADVILFA